MNDFLNPIFLSLISLNILFLLILVWRQLRFSGLQKRYSLLTTQVEKLKEENESSKQSLEESSQDDCNEILTGINSAYTLSSDLLANIDESLSDIIQIFQDECSKVELIAKESEGSADDLGKSKKKFQNLGQAMEELKGLEKLISDSQKEIQEVQDRSKNISDIAFQAKLLSFNASVEAARAGEAGKGFAVVAEEVGNLANLSEKTAKEIIERLNSNLNSSEKVLTTISEKVDMTHKLVLEVNESFESIYNSGQKVSQQTSDIARSIQTSGDNINHTSNDIKSNLEGVLNILAKMQGEMTGVKVVDLNVKKAFGQLNEFDAIIDVRRDEEFSGELGHINGSRLWTLQTSLEEKLTSLEPEGRYLFVCRSGGRSAKACRSAQMKGLKNVFNLEGGMLAWNEANLPRN